MELQPLPEKINIPETASELNPDWFSRCLSRHFQTKIVVHSIEEKPLMGGIPVTSTVQRWCLDSEGNAPRSVIVKLNKSGWSEKHGTALYERELKFYEELIGAHEAPVPQCYFAAGDEENKHFAFVLEDLSEARPGHCLAGLTVDQAIAAMVDLANFEKDWWNSDALENWPRKMVTQEGLEKFVGYFETHWPRLLESGKYKVSEALNNCVTHFDRRQFYQDRLNGTQEPLTLVHGDLHAENFIIDDSKLVIFDWQNAAFGHPSIDATQLLNALNAEEMADSWQVVLRKYSEALGHLSFLEMERAVRAQARSVFMGVACWLVTFEADSLRDASTIQNYWSRLSELMICLSR